MHRRLRQRAGLDQAVERISVPEYSEKFPETDIEWEEHSS